MDGVTRHSRATSSPAAKQPANDGQPPVTPVKSAKDAINAMYASDPSTRLSQYLATSAKDIINASSDSKLSGSRSAASLHHSSSQRRLKSVRPSASAIFRNSDTEDPAVVRTSLKLKPQKAAPARPPKQKKIQIDSVTTDINSPRPKASPQSRRQAKPTRPQPASQQPSHTQAQQGQPRPAGSRRFMQDVIRTPRAQASQAGQPAQVTHPSHTVPPAQSSQNVPHPRGNIGMDPQIRPSAPGVVTPPMASPAPTQTASVVADVTDSVSAASKPKAKSRSLESIKKRLRPKGNKSTTEPDRPKRYHAEDFLQPDYADTPVQVEPPKEAVHIYGMSPEPEPSSEPPAWAQNVNTSAPTGDVKLGVIEDYSPNGSNPTNATASTGATPHSPDVLGGDSPFFLKSVSVEKRPLSDAPPRRNPQIERPTRITPSTNDTNLLSSEEPESNTGAKKPKKVKKPKPTKSPKSSKPSKHSKNHHDDLEPTVIIPQRSGSHTSLIVLLVLTIIIGALVGAATYLFLFQ